MSVKSCSTCAHVQTGVKDGHMTYFCRLLNRPVFFDEACLYFVATEVSEK